MDLRAPVRLQLRKIFDRSRVVPVEIHAADAVLLIEAVIHFAQRVVDAHSIGESLDDVGALGVVNREARAGTSDARP